MTSIKFLFNILIAINVVIQLANGTDDEGIPLPPSDEELLAERFLSSHFEKRGLSNAEPAPEMIPLNLEDLEHQDITRRSVQETEVDVETRGGGGGYPAVGMDMEQLQPSHPKKMLRKGQATDTHSCNEVRKVPSELRSAANMYPSGINSFYTKYTETYNIPIVGSNDVTDEGLKRACFLIHFLLSARYDIRNAYYKWFGKIAIIGDKEQTTSLPEYRHLSKDWDTRTRGIGPTILVPTTSAGDDNACCKAGDRYFDQDILLHEFAHTMHQLGAAYVIPGFEKRLGEIYEANVKKARKWAGTYAAENRHEYLAVGTQFFFGAFKTPGKYLSSFGVKDRATLKKYDPKLEALISEMFPCTNSHLIQRCDWKICTLKNFELLYDTSYRAQSKCTELKSASVSNSEDCAETACYYMGNTVNYKGSTCKVTKCEGGDLNIIQGKTGFNVYEAKTLPKLTLEKEKKQTLTYECTKGVVMPGMCNGVSSSSNLCGDPKTTSQTTCSKRGCCWVGGKCVYGKQICSNKNTECPEMAKDGDCKRNPGYMYRMCPLACEICDKVHTLKEDDLMGLCQDTNAYCVLWKNKGECTKNKSYMSKTCPISCGTCKTPSDPLG